MSFILDALRKAEHKNRDRHNMTVPTGPRVLTEELPDAPAERHTWPWVALVTVIAVIAAWWFFPTEPSAPLAGNPAEVVDTGNVAPPDVPSYAGQSPAPGNEIRAERANMQRDTGARDLNLETRRGLDRQSSTTRTEQNQAAGSLATPSATTTSRRVTPGTVRILEPDGSLRAETPVSTPGTTLANPSARPPGRVEIESLPEYRASLASGEVPIPELHLDMHVFSTQPAKRFVFINLDKYAEGDAIDRDTTVESIEPEGAVINHKGYRFVLRPQ